MHPDRLFMCWAAGRPWMTVPACSINNQKKKWHSALISSWLSVVLVVRLFLSKETERQHKRLEIRTVEGEEKHRPGGKASCNVLFRVCTLSLLPFESTQNYLHLRGNWTAHQSISKSQIFCDSSLVWSPRFPLVSLLVSHPDSDKLLLCSARLKIKSI